MYEVTFFRIIMLKHKHSLLNCKNFFYYIPV